MKLLVDKDFESTCIWEPMETGGWANTSHEHLDLPQWLVERMNFLSDWYEHCDTAGYEGQFDWSSYNAYKLSVAIDLKFHLGTKAQVFVRDGDGIAEVTLSPFQTRAAPSNNSFKPKPLRGSA